MTEKIQRIFLYGGFVCAITLIVSIIIMVASPKLTFITTEISESDNTLGNKDAKVILIEYSDFQCPACGLYAELVSLAMKEFENHVLFAYRSFPLRKIHPNAVTSAQAAQAAGLQGKFWEMHDKLFEEQQKWGPESEKDAVALFKEYAEELGLDVKKFEEDLYSNKVLNKVLADEASAKDANLGHTPTFFLNGEEIKNPKTLEEFRQILRTAIEESKK